MNLDITRPLALMSIIIGVILYLYGQMVAMPFAFDIPHGVVPIKIDQPCGLFFVLFGFVIWQFGRFSKIKSVHAGIKKREKELKIKEPKEKVESVEEIKSVETTEAIEEAKPEKSDEK